MSKKQHKFILNGGISIGAASFFGAVCKRMPAV